MSAQRAPVMTEDQLTAGLIDALGLAGWKRWHVRRSDRGLWMGDRGWPDITALPPRLAGPLLVLEVKSADGRLAPEQATWLALLHRAGVTVGVIRPDRYDRAVGLILAGDASADAWAWAFRL